MLKKHRGHLINNRKIIFQPSFLKQELDHPIIKPNFYWVLCATYVSGSFTCLGSFILLILIWASAVWSDFPLNSRGRRWWKMESKPNPVLLGKMSLFQHKGIDHYSLFSFRQGIFIEFQCELLYYKGFWQCYGSTYTRYASKSLT